MDALAAAAARHNLEAETITESLAGGDGVQRSDDMDVEQGGGGLDAPGGDEGPPGKKGCACAIM